MLAWENEAGSYLESNYKDELEAGSFNVFFCVSGFAPTPIFQY